MPAEDFEIVVNLESWATGEQRARRVLRVDASVRDRRLKEWRIENGVAGRVLASSAQMNDQVKLALLRNFEFKLPLVWLLATPGGAERAGENKAGAVAVAATSRLRLRFSLWQNRLPVDSLPLEGWIELQVVSEGELLFGA
jgi:hypothetical protein